RGTSVFARRQEARDEDKGRLVIDTSGVDGEGRIILYVSLKEGLSLTEGLKDKIRQELRRRLSPRHTPDEIHQVPAIPRTLNGKKIEVPVKRILQGTPVDKALAAGSLDNPAALEGFLEVVLRSAGAGPRQSPAASGP